MGAFWVLVALLTCAAVAAVAWPLLRTRAPADDDETARRLSVYRDRRREIEAERDAGRLGAAEAQLAIDELAADAARQPLGEPTTRAASAPRRLGVAAVVAVAVPLIAVAVYGYLGAPLLVDPHAATAARGETPELTPEMLDRAIADLEQRSRAPDATADTFAMLAQARRLKGDAPGAVAAYEQAIERAPNDARLLADLAETEALVREGRFAGRPLELLERALAIDPSNPKAMAMMGIAQYRLGNPRKGLEYLRGLQASAPAGSEQARRIGEVVARIESELGDATGPRAPDAGDATGPRAPDAGASTGATAAAPSAAARPASPPDAAAPASPGASAATGGAATRGSISGTVSISDVLRRELPGDATVFVVARAPEGPRVPYAVMRLRVSDLPAPFTLSDAQAMDPQRTLSSASQVVVEARVSRSGTANREAGDPIGRTAPMAPGARDVALTIDRTVER